MTCQQCPELVSLRARDAALMSKHGQFKGTGNVELDACLQTPDAAFDAFKNSMPPSYWARYDLSAVRLGWHYGRLRPTSVKCDRCSLEGDAALGGPVCMAPDCPNG